MLSFAYPHLLWLLPALAAPVLLHLMKRSITVNITFPTIRFLSRGKLPKEGKRRLRDLLLLLLRLLLFAAIIMTVAGPKLARELVPEIVSTEKKPVIIAVDSSASMSSLADYSKLNPVLDMIFTNNVSATIISFDESVSTLAENIDSCKQAKEIIAKIKPVPYRNRTAVFAEKVAKIANSITKGDLYLFSDFQKTAWQTAELQRLPSEVKLHLIDISQKVQDNLAIMKAEIQPSKEGRSHISMQIHNFAASPATPTVIFKSGDINEKKKVHVPPGRSINTTMVTFTPDSPSGTLSLSEDKEDYDGQYHLWTGNPPPIEILVAAPFEQEPEKKIELFFLQKALSIPLPNAPRPINITPVDPQLFELVDVNAADAVILQGGAGYFKDEAFVVLKKFLGQGGVAMITPGKTAANQYLGLRKHEILNCRFTGMSRRTRKTEPFYASQLAKNCELSAVFPAPEETDLFQFPIYRYCRLQSFSPAEVLISADNGDPLLTAQRVGKGRIFSFAFSLGNQWSDLPLTSSFLPLIKEIFKQDNFSNCSGVQRVECTANHPVHKKRFNAPGITTILQRPFEINVSRGESIVDKVNLTELRRAMTGSMTTKGDKKLQKKSSDFISLTPYLAGLTALLFILEMIFSFVADRKEFRRTANA